MLHRAGTLMLWTRCIVRSMRNLVFGILGAVGAVLYWWHTASADPFFQLAGRSTAAFDGLIYAAAGFVVGWVIGFARVNIRVVGASLPGLAFTVRESEVSPQIWQ